MIIMWNRLLQILTRLDFWLCRAPIVATGCMLYVRRTLRQQGYKSWSGLKVGSRAVSSQFMLMRRSGRRKMPTRPLV